MTTITATEARKNLFKMFWDITQNHKTFKVKYKNKNVVIVNEEDFEELQETLELLSSPGFKKNLAEAKKDIDNNDLYDLDEVLWDV